VHPPPTPAWANFTLMIECTPESTLCTLREDSNLQSKENPEEEILETVTVYEYVKNLPGTCQEIRYMAFKKSATCWKKDLHW
jgi:hypothetical protein